jgi:hypothetical protein
MITKQGQEVIEAIKERNSAVMDSKRQKVSQETEILEASKPMVRRKFSGVARVCRKEGCTVRNGIDIDESDPVFSLQFDDLVHFDRVAICPAADDDCVPVDRLHVLFSLIDGQSLEGWASLRGRFREDNGFMFEVLSEPYTKEVPFDSVLETLPVIRRKVEGDETLPPVTNKASVVNDHRNDITAHHFTASTSNNDELNRLNGLTECPICQYRFPTYSSFTHLHKKKHMDKCCSEFLTQPE